ncbi:nucleoside 2-deoxyribosyltransferase [Terasakiella pusilla]|uniref:nucleoside 2-deoxyribosyltransferase n=1 Tax=Terasakiella pusilla TaxID=64973 RepID=UPI003AA7CFEE
MTKKIYLAGPGVFYPDPLAEGERLKDLCARFGLQGVFPMDAALDLTDMEKGEAAHAIYQANIDLIAQSDALIADMQAFRGPGMDGGTAFEMGYAVALGKPVVGYNAQGFYLARTRQYYKGLHSTEGHEVDPAGLTVEDFDQVDNLMMSCSADVMVADEKAALEWLTRHFEEG